MVLSNFPNKKKLSSNLPLPIHCKGKTEKENSLLRAHNYMHNLYLLDL